MHGVSRGTRDLDLFTLRGECLDPTVWAPLESGGVTARIRRGDADDPLAGVVRLTIVDGEPVDIVVGKSPWQSAIVDRARPTVIANVRLPVVRASDLVLLKLYGGGPQDAWDIEQLLSAGDRAALIAEVDSGIAPLPEEARALWRRISGAA